MKRLRALAGIFASLALTATVAPPVLADGAPPTLSIETAPTHYLGGWWEQQIGFKVTCDGFGTQEIWVDLPGSSGDILPQLGPVPVGTTCWIDVSYWPEPGENANWNDAEFTPGPEFTLQEGPNQIDVIVPRLWAAEWPPETDTGAEHAMDLAVTKVYLNGKGGIEVEGTSWCDATDILTGDFEADLYAGVHWAATQYVGRKTALGGEYFSGIAHPCWLGSEPNHGPYAWQTRYAYPSGALQWVYAWNGKFGSGTIHVEANSDVEAVVVSENFVPGGWTSYEGQYVPYQADCEDNNGDGWCVAQHGWYGWAQADLKPIRVR